MNRPARCKHFTGIQHDECAAGVNYREHFGSHNGWAKSIQCTDEKGAVPCPKLDRMTLAELEAEDSEIDAIIERMRVVQTAIRPWREKHSGESLYEQIECPICEGALHLSISAVNNHVHGKCETEGCVSWME